MDLEYTQLTNITRDFELELERRIKQQLPFIQVVIGPRQVGKTTAVGRVASRFQGPKHFASADDPIPKSAEWLRLQWEEALRLGEGALLVIDEIQKVSGWAETIKSLYDPIRLSRRLNIVLLGSASLSIQQGLTAALSGRFEVLRASHWGLAESAQAFGWDLDHYLSFGGYPAAAHLVSDQDRWRNFMLDSVIEPVLGRDIAGLVQIAKPALFRQTFELAMGYPSQVLSYNKLLGQLQEGGNTSTVRHYLELLEGAFLVRLIPRFASGKIQRRTSSPKIVPLAPALAQAYRPPSISKSDLSWRGRLLESVVGAYLVGLPGTISYWNEGDFEVDFVREHEGKVLGIEVKSSRKRKARGLERFLRTFPKAQGRILSAEDIEKILFHQAPIDG